MNRIALTILLVLLAVPAFAERYWVGPVVWTPATANAPAFYGSPANVTGWIDLRTPAECGLANGTGTGVAFFTTADATSLGGSYSNLGTDLERVLTNPQRSSLQTALRLPNVPGSNVLGEILYEALTTQSDPAGTSRVPTLIPNDQGRIEIWVAGRKVRDRAFNPANPEATNIQAALRRHYKQLRDAVVAGHLPENQHRKVLGFWVRQYRAHSLSYRWFQGADVPDESDLPPSTTYTESWPTNSSTLSSGQDQPWTEVASDATVASGALTVVSSSTAPHVRCNTALSSSDNYAQGVILNAPTTTTRSIGPACRYAASADDCYATQIHGGTGGTRSYRIVKVVTGTMTDLGTGTNQTADGTAKVSASGTTIKAFWGGSEVESITDSALSTGVRCGVVFDNAVNTQTLDTFEAGDLAAAGTSILEYYTRQQQ